VKNAIESRLTCLVGLPFRGARRVGTAVTFHFGAPDASLMGAVSYALRVESPWRLRMGSTLVAGAADQAWPSSSTTARNAHEGAATLLDDKLTSMRGLVASGEVVVERATADEHGSLTLAMSGLVALDLFPACSTSSPHAESWRFEGSGIAPFVVRPLRAREERDDTSTSARL
jgi:hypothetical protein